MDLIIGAFKEMGLIKEDDNFAYAPVDFANDERGQDVFKDKEVITGR